MTAHHLFLGSGTSSGIYNYFVLYANLEQRGQQRASILDQLLAGYLSADL